jgi:hypothetical protein
MNTKSLLQIFSGLVSSVAIIALYIFTGVPMWEHQSPDGNSYILGWRTAIVFLVLFAITQWISLLAFRWMKSKDR